MRVEVDYDKSVFDEFKEGMNEQIKDTLIKEGKAAISEARATKTYKNQTWDLVNAYGFGVVMYGKLVYIEVPAQPQNAHVIKETEETIRRIALDSDDIALIIANGKEYASYVQAKGREVLKQSVNNTYRRLNVI